MDVIDRSRMWKNLKQRLGLKRIGCCGGAIFSSATPTITIIETLNLDDSDHEDHRNSVSVPFVSRDAAAEDSSMNLAMALAAERSYQVSNAGPPGVGRVKTLMALIEETDGVDLKIKKREKRATVAGVEVGEGGGGGGDGVCCVCMERNKGAAFIPCGHTFCRVCSRELWLNRGACPICNRAIGEILDIF